jgi:hypothetical protein
VIRDYSRTLVFTRSIRAREDSTKKRTPLLRTFQRQVKRWRGLEGPGQEVFFAQEHHPGRLCQSDFSHMTKLGVTIGGRSLAHLIYHFVLTYPIASKLASLLVGNHSGGSPLPVRRQSVSLGRVAINRCCRSVYKRAFPICNPLHLSTLARGQATLLYDTRAGYATGPFSARRRLRHKLRHFSDANRQTASEAASARPRHRPAGSRVAGRESAQSH